ncbi:MAG: dotC [Gammaproteobacteria bacterium]|jgi:defect-in-organelle-trafficking protein DotC|nr:dotC [Gammaproteobacteria bacterium]
MRKSHHILTIMMLCLVMLLTACSSKRPKGPMSELNGYPSSKESSTGISQIRMGALQETATTTGAQSALSWESQRINKFLEQDAHRLSKAFNFQALVLENNVLPPVLSEGRNALNLDDSETVRLADQVYKIESPPRFVTAAPSWREYLWMNYEKPEKPNSSLLPRDDEERKVWNIAVMKGWEEGIKQANQIFSANMGRMKRDYNGMVLYRVLLAQKMVTAPYVAKTEMGVTGDAKELRINDQVLRITATSRLVPDSKQWRSVAVPGVEGVWRTQGTQGTKTLQ